MAGLQNNDLNGTYVDPNKTAWGGDAGDAPIDHYQGSMGVDQYGIPTPTGNRTDWIAAQRSAQATSGQAQDVARYRGMADAAAYRSAPTLNYGDAYAGLDESARMRGLGGGESRQAQLSALALQRQAAEGSAPSQAQILGSNMIGQSLQAQLAGAAGARGGGMAQAAAMRQAAQGAAAFQQQGTTQLAGLRAQEMATARDAYSQGAYNIRAGDYTGAATANQAAAQAAQMEQVRAATEMQQRTLNQNGQLGFEQLGFNVNQSALNANLGLAGNAQANDQFRTQMAMADQQRSDAMWAAAMSAGSTVAAGAMTRRAGGGPVSPGQPVLVGERGPEVIVPSQAGTVLPATHPASQRAAQQNMSMSDVARLRQQADAIEAGLKRQMDAGPSARRLAGGGPENGFTTQLVPAAEQSYERWRQSTSPWDTGSDYDLRGAYADGIDRDGRGHMPDTYKKPNHPTFSDESKYAAHGTPGHWVGDRFVPSQRVITMAPVVIDDAPEVPYGGMSARPAPQVDMSARERLIGGREGYDAPQLQPLYGGREDPYQYGGAREEGGPVESDKAYLVGEQGPEVIVPKYTYDASQPFGDRFVPNPAYVPQAPPESQKPVYFYDASKPFGDRFVPAAPRQATFERNDDAAKARAAKEHEAAANENARAAALLTLLQGPGVAAPAAGSGIAHYLQSLLARGGSQ